MFDVLAQLLPQQGMAIVLPSELGAPLAARFPNLAWQPAALPGAAIAPRDDAAPSNVLRAIELDVRQLPWPIAKADAVVAIDLVHVIAWELVQALFAGAARVLPSGGLLFLHGPFRFHGKYATAADQELDQSLRARDPSTGLRDIRELTVAGTRSGIGLEHTIAMPTGGHALAFRRRALLPPTGQFRI